MPTFAQGSRTSLSYIVESTFGTTPAGNFTNLPFSTHSLNLTKERVQGNDLQSDRMPRVDRHGNKQAGGDIVVDLRDGDYDDFLESAMLGTFSTNVLKVGTAPKYFSVEDYAADIDQAKLFTGCTVSSMGISLAPNQMVTTTFSMVGKGMTLSATQKTQDAASGAAPFDAYSGDLSIGNVGSLSASAIVTAVDFTVDNAFAPTFVVGSDETPALQYGRATVEGTFSAYFEDAALVNRFLNETNSALQVSVNDPTGSNEYTFLFPYIKINSADTSVGGPESRMVECSFVALYDSTEATNLKITRPS
ncbi:phage tail tube protein [Gammaproteobacteria bacterium]|nr:phage tail tube protein [Gammaproteobacteria bacterium]